MTESKRNYWKQWAIAALIRSVRTFAQVAIVSLPTTSFALGDINWVIVGSTATAAAIVSILMSLAGLPEVPVPEDGD